MENQGPMITLLIEIWLGLIVLGVFCALLGLNDEYDEDEDRRYS